MSATGEASSPSAVPGAWAARAGERLAGGRFAAVHWLAETGSTNADVMTLARDGAPEGTVVVADHQREGRGRRARSWVAPPGGSLLVSVLLRPAAPVAGASTMAAALSMAEAVEEVTGVAPGLKWPNDLVVGDRKLAGVLAEADWPAGTSASGGWRPPPPHLRVPVVVGVGLNVAWPAELPPAIEDVADRAVSLDRLLPPAGGTAGLRGRGAGAPGAAGAAHSLPGGPEARPGESPVDRLREDLLVAFLRRLGGHYGALTARGATDGVVDAWRRRSATLGRRVRVDVGREDVVGVAADVTAEGHLVVEATDGRLRTLAAGDVVHLRPA